VRQSKFFGWAAGVETLEPPPVAANRRWPALFDVRPQLLVATFGALVLAMWLLVFLVDVHDLFREPPAWPHLFNSRPVEWSQWFVLAATVAAAAYASARVPQPEAASFFILLAVATGLMLIEDAGDIRHVISDYAVAIRGARTLGVPTETLSDLAYFAALSATPVYALMRYGRGVWVVPRARVFMCWGYGLYALAAIGSGLSGMGLYLAVGRWIDTQLMGGHLHIPDGTNPDWVHFMLVDGPVEESLETMGAVCLLGMVLAYVNEVRMATSEQAPREEARDTEPPTSQRGAVTVVRDESGSRHGRRRSGRLVRRRTDPRP
jgi:hypothetical protein